MSELQTIIDNVDAHLKEISNMSESQIQTVHKLIEENEEKIKSHQAFDTAEEINQKVNNLMKAVTDDLDKAVKTITEKISNK